ncbi:hypothetical protein B0H14DRAFT_2558784 [Mycena olivaceomarginata]|nr:hypothetical protein B0H14DRAFT_2558784 [Mycena olivaceomarginata]
MSQRLLAVVVSFGIVTSGANETHSDIDVITGLACPGNCTLCLREEREEERLGILMEEDDKASRLSKRIVSMLCPPISKYATTPTLALVSHLARISNPFNGSGEQSPRDSERVAPNWQTGIEW